MYWINIWKISVFIVSKADVNASDSGPSKLSERFEEILIASFFFLSFFFFSFFFIEWPYLSIKYYAGLLGHTVTQFICFLLLNLASRRRLYLFIWILEGKKQNKTSTFHIPQTKKVQRRMQI